MSIESLVLVAGLLLLAGVVASRLSDRLGVPSLLLFLAVGMLAGSEGVGGIAFESASQARSLGTVALLVILFSGGLDTRWAAVRPVLAPGLVLSTVGVVGTTLVLGVFGWFMLGTYGELEIGTGGLDWAGALLLAAIVSSTDAAAVFSVFAASPVRPRSRLRALLEFESGSNDPMAVLLTTLILGTVAEGATSVVGAAAGLLLQFVVGGVLGAGVGLAASWLVNRARLSSPMLYPILVLAGGLIAFGAAHALRGNGYLAVYAAGVVLGNRIETNRGEILGFHEGLSWLMQISMFVVLGLLVFPSRLPAVAGVALAMALFLMFVARPLVVVLCLAVFRPRWNELAYVSWVGLRGSVPIVLATFPAAYGIEGAEAIFDVIFFVVLVSVALQGLTLVPATRWLGVVEIDATEG